MSARTDLNASFRAADAVALSLFRASYASLTRRQKETISAFCRSADRAAAAALLGVTEAGAKNTLSAAYVRLGIRGGRRRAAQSCYFLGQMEAGGGDPAKSGRVGGDR